MGNQHIHRKQAAGTPWRRPEGMPSSWRRAVLVGLTVPALTGLTQIGREWTDVLCAAIRLAVAALPSVTAIATHAMQAHAAQRILEGFLRAGECFGMVMVRLVTRM